MAETVDRLRAEHRSLAKLLDILESELAAFDAAGSPDYERMAAIADYFLEYPAACHHPKEDAVYRVLVERSPEVAGTVGDIEAEHVSIGELVKLFAQAVRNVTQDVVVPRETFDHIVRHFIDEQRKHIDVEEGQLFPLALEVLTADDWTTVDGRVGDQNDPLFGDLPEERFAELRSDIEAWES